MDLGGKTAAIITVAVALGLTAIFGTAGVVLVDNYQEVERAAAIDDALRVEGMVRGDLRDLEWNARELVGLAEALFAGAAGDAGNGTDNRTLGLFHAHFLANELDAAFLRGPDGATSGFTFDPDHLIFGAADAALNASVAESGLLDPGTPGAAVSRLLAADGVVYLAAAHPLSTPLAPNVTGGVVVLRAVDGGYVAGLARATQEDLRLRPWDAATDAALALDPQGVALRRHDWDHMTVEHRIDDATGGPVLVLEMHQPRTVFREGIDAITYFFVASLLIAGIFLTAGLTLLRFRVTGRVQRLSQRMREIADSGDLEGRAGVGGADEVSRLADDFNVLMDTLEARTARLESTNQDLQSFARVVAHDLKSPLSTLSLNIGLLRHGAEASGAAKDLERLERMERTMLGMDHRIAAILSYSRQRGEAVDPHPVALQDVVAGVLLDLEGELTATGAEVKVGPLPVVVGDAAQLAQVFQNLISNAIKFARGGERPRVRVRADREGRGWAVHVEDDGIGFAQEDVARLFLPFARLEGGMDRPGDGVGLATCARIMERHGGRLTARGTPGEGACFTVHLRGADAGASG